MKDAQNITAQVVGNELVIRAKLDSPIGVTEPSGNKKGGSIVLAQTPAFGGVDVGRYAFRCSVWIPRKSESTRAALQPVGDDAIDLVAELLQEATKGKK